MLKRSAPILIALSLLAPASLRAQGAAAPEGTAVSPAGKVAAASATAAEATGDKAMQTNTVEGYKAAVAQYDKAVKEEPQSWELRRKLTDALVSVMRRQTGANLPLADGKTVDTPQNRKIWSTYGPRAVKLGEQLVKERPNSKEARALYLEAFMYQSSSYGIVQAFLTGAADTYRDAANALVKLDPAYNGAMGYVYLGAFYLEAPWPMTNLKRSLGYLQQAVDAAPESSDGHYLLAVTAFKHKDMKTARENFQWVLDNPCGPATAVDYCGVMQRQAKRGVELTSPAS